MPAGRDVPGRGVRRPVRPARRGTRAFGPSRAALGLACVLALVLFARVAGSSSAQETARIDLPAEVGADGRVELRGRAVGRTPESFDFYRLYVGPGEDPANVRPVGQPYTEPVEDGVLATADANRLPPGRYLLVLRVYERDGAISEAAAAFSVAPRPTPTPFATLEAVGPPDAPVTLDPTPVPLVPVADVPPALVPIVLPDFSAEPDPAPLPDIGGPPSDPNPIQPIPADPSGPPADVTAPGPIEIGTPDTNRLPGEPPPVYLTPVPGF